MRTLLVALTLLAAPAALADIPPEPPAPAPAAEATSELGTYSEGGASVLVPMGWTAMIDLPKANVVLSAGLTTQLTLFWYPNRDGARPELMLDLVRRVIQEKLPIGTYTESERGPLEGGIPMYGADQRGLWSTGSITALTYEMKVAMVTYVDEPAGRMMAAVFFGPPEDYDKFGGHHLVDRVVRSLRTPDDPLMPRPAWWFDPPAPPESLTP